MSQITGGVLGGVLTTAGDALLAPTTQVINAPTTGAPPAVGGLTGGLAGVTQALGTGVAQLGSGLSQNGLGGAPVVGGAIDATATTADHLVGGLATVNVLNTPVTGATGGSPGLVGVGVGSVAPPAQVASLGVAATPAAPTQLISANLGGTQILGSPTGSAVVGASLLSGQPATGGVVSATLLPTSGNGAAGGVGGLLAPVTSATGGGGGAVGGLLTPVTSLVGGVLGGLPVLNAGTQGSTHVQITH